MKKRELLRDQPWQQHNSHLRADLSFTKNTQRDDQMEAFTAWPLLCCPEAVFKRRLHRLQLGHLLEMIRWWNQDRPCPVKPWFLMQTVEKCHTHLSLKAVLKGTGAWTPHILEDLALRASVSFLLEENPGKHTLSEILHRNTWLSPVAAW